MVSVVIPTYNRSHTLSRAINSVLNQSHSADEIIVVDDGSCDNSREVLRNYPQIRYIYQENSGVSSARNSGIKASSHEWIAFLDSDDEWHEDKLLKQINFHKQNQNILFSYTDESWIRDGKCVNLPKKFQKISGDIFTKMLSHCIIAPSSAMIHRSIFERVGLFDESLEVCEDYDLWLRISKMYEIALIDEKLITKYGGDEDQLSTKHWGMDRFRVKALQKHADNTEAKKELIKKYELLLKGAIKHNKTDLIQEYEKCLEDLKK